MSAIAERKLNLKLWPKGTDPWTSVDAYVATKKDNLEQLRQYLDAEMPDLAPWVSSTELVNENVLAKFGVGGVNMSIAVYPPTFVRQPYLVRLYAGSVSASARGASPELAIKTAARILEVAGKAASKLAK